MDVWVREGREALSQSGEALDVLHAVTGAPVTARRTWLQAWVESYPLYQPIVLGVEGSNGGLAAAALLATRRSHGVHQVVACGHGPTDAVSLSALDDTSAVRLADALAVELRRLRAPWRLGIRQLVADDTVAPRLASRLPRAHLVPGDVSPLLRADLGDSLRDYVSSTHHRGISRIRNRMVREGLEPQVRHVRHVEEVMTLLPEVEQVYRRRDEELGRKPALDVSCHRDFFRRVVERHAADGEVCLTTLRLNDELAAYTLCFVDGDVYRMWNCRFDPAWARFSPGKLAVDESVRHALVAGCSAYDFMRGDEPYKDSYANERPTTLDLFASSGPVLAAGTAAFLGARRRMRQMDQSGGRGAALVARARGLQESLGRL